MDFLHTLGMVSPVLVPVIVMTFLLLSKNLHNAKLFLAFLMFILSFTFLSNYFYFESDFKTYAFLHSLHVASVLMIYPSVYIYILFLTQEKIKFKKIYIHYLPALGFGLVSACFFYFFLGQNERVEYLSSYRLNHEFSNLYMNIIYTARVLNIICLFLQIPLYFYLSNRYLLKHKKQTEDLYSETSGFDLRWIKKFNIAFFLAAAFSISFYAINPVKLFGNDFFLMVPLYMLSVIMCGFGIIGNNQSLVILKKETGIPGANEYNTSLKKDIDNLLVNKKVYLNQGLKISEMATTLKTNRTYLSQEINRNYMLNFNQLINKYRIEEAKKLLKSSKANRMPLEEVAELCGWGSLSSLNRAFKNHGLSPAKFREQWQLKKK